MEYKGKEVEILVEPHGMSMTYIIIAALIIVIIAMWLQMIHNEKEEKGKKSRQVPYDPNSDDPQHHFRAAQIALRENKVMIVTKEDVIYVRLAGNAGEGEAFRYEWGKVIDFSMNKKENR
jgi:hypothetical protein